MLVKMSGANSDDLHERLRVLLYASGQQRLEKNLSELLCRDHYRERFGYLCQFVPLDSRDSILVSGSAIGTEMLVAREYGFDFVLGTEIVPELAALTKIVFSEESRCLTALYDGSRLPFADSSFSVVSSGHVIEHTPDPSAYLDEHLRVLKPGGKLFLEFPDRFGAEELHCQTVGFEWAPSLVRHLCYHRLLSKYQTTDPTKCKLYGLILDTLKPIGIADVQRIISRNSDLLFIRHAYKPARGFVRLIVEKSQG